MMGEDVNVLEKLIEEINKIGLGNFIQPEPINEGEEPILEITDNFLKKLYTLWQREKGRFEELKDEIFEKFPEPEDDFMESPSFGESFMLYGKIKMLHFIFWYYVYQKYSKEMSEHNIKIGEDEIDIKEGFKLVKEASKKCACPSCTGMPSIMGELMGGIEEIIKEGLAPFGIGITISSGPPTSGPPTRRETRLVKNGENKGKLFVSPKVKPGKNIIN